MGSKFEVTGIGVGDPWPCQIWCSHEGIRFTPLEEQKGRFTVEIDKKVPCGAYLVRAFNDEGASSPVIFVVGDVER